MDITKKVILNMQRLEDYLDQPLNIEISVTSSGGRQPEMTMSKIHFLRKMDLKIVCYY